MTFALFEHDIRGNKHRVNDKAYASMADALAPFGDKVVEAEVSEDGMACDFFVNVGVGAVYAIEAI